MEPRGEFRLKGTGYTTWARRHRRSHSQPAPERLRAALLHIAGGMFGDLVSAFWRRVSPPANSTLGAISVVISSAFWGVSSVNEGAFSSRRGGVIQSNVTTGTTLKAGPIMQFATLAPSCCPALASGRSRVESRSRRVSRPSRFNRCDRTAALTSAGPSICSTPSIPSRGGSSRAGDFRAGDRSGDGSHLLGRGVDRVGSVRLVTPSRR